MDKFKEIFKKSYIFIIIFILAFAVRCVGIIKKDCMFFDSTSSIVITTPNNLDKFGNKFKKTWMEFDLKSGEEYTGKELKKAFFETTASPKDIIRDIKSIYNEPSDPSHPNLYYSILRVWNAGIDGLKYKEIIYRDCGLNLIFFTISFIFLYKLLALIKDDKKFIALGLFFASLCSGGISDTLLIRMYALMETLMIICTYYSFYVWKIIRSDKTTVPLKQFCLFSVFLALFAITNYFAAVYNVVLFFWLAIAALANKKYKILAQLFAILGVALGVIVLLCKKYFNLTSTDYYNECHTIIVTALNFFDRFAGAFEETWSYIVDFAYYKVFLCAAVILYIYSNIKFEKGADGIVYSGKFLLTKKDLAQLGVLFAVGFIWCILIMLVTPRHHFRYMLPVFPIFATVLTIFAYNLKRNCLIILLALYFCLSTLPVLADIQVKSLTGQVANLYDCEEFKVRNEGKLPIVVVARNWALANLIMFLRDDDKVVFETVLPKADYKFDHYLLVSSLPLTFPHWPENIKERTIGSEKLQGIYVSYEVEKNPIRLRDMANVFNNAGKAVENKFKEKKTKTKDKN